MEIIKTIFFERVKRYFVSVIIFAIATIYFLIIQEIHTSSNEISAFNQNAIKIILSLIYGGVLSITIGNIVLKIDNKKYYLLYLFVPLGMLINYYFIVNDLNYAETSIKYVLYNFSTCLLFLILPFIKDKKDKVYYTYEVLKGMLLTGIIFLITFLCILGIWLTIVNLFNIDFNGLMFMKVVVSVLGFIMPTVLCILLPDINTKDENYIKYISKILMYIIMPALIIYTIILYIYFIKILIEFKLPTNMLGNLVIYYSIISIVVLYFIKNISNKFINKFTKIYPYILIIPVVMMLLGFVIRINEYGITMFRYYALLTAAFTLISILLIKINKYNYIILIGAILILLSLFGPLSSANLSRESQEQRLHKLLIKNSLEDDKNILDYINNFNGKTLPLKYKNTKDFNEIRDIIRYLNNYHSKSKIFQK